MVRESVARASDHWLLIPEHSLHRASLCSQPVDLDRELEQILAEIAPPLMLLGLVLLPGIHPIEPATRAELRAMVGGGWLYWAGDQLIRCPVLTQEWRIHEQTRTIAKEILSYRAARARGYLG